MKLQIVKTDNGYAAVKEDGITIIATDTSFKLEGIPQFELEKEGWKSEIKKVFPKLYNSNLDKVFIRHTEDGFMEGYKAAQEKGCYSIEDMNWVANMASGMALSGKSLSDINNQLTIKIQSLNQPKKLVAIEVEPYFTDEAERLEGLMRDGEGIKPEPLIVKSEEYPDGLLTVQKYYHEKYKA